MKSGADPSSGWGGPGVFCEESLQGNKIFKNNPKMETKTKGGFFYPFTAEGFPGLP